MSFKYLFTHAFPEIFNDLSHGLVKVTRANPIVTPAVLSNPDEEGNTTVLQEERDEAPDGSTVVLRPGDIVESDVEIVHAHLEPIVDEAATDAEKLAADAKDAADKAAAALKPAAPAAPVTPPAEAPAVPTTTTPPDTTKEV